MTTDHAVDIDKQVRIYITVFVSLMALTIITVAISRFHLPIHLAVTVALFVAIIKGSLVACYFMVQGAADGCVCQFRNRDSSIAALSELRIERNAPKPGNPERWCLA